MVSLSAWSKIGSPVLTKGDAWAKRSLSKMEMLNFIRVDLVSLDLVATILNSRMNSELNSSITLSFNPTTII